MFNRCVLHTSVPLVFCYVLKRMHRFIVNCSRYLFWFHINQSGNTLLASQSEEVTLSLQFLVVDTSNWPISALDSSHWLVSFNRLFVTTIWCLSIRVARGRFGYNNGSFIVYFWILWRQSEYSQGWFLTILDVAFERPAPSVGHLM